MKQKAGGKLDENLSESLRYRIYDYFTFDKLLLLKTHKNFEKIIDIRIEKMKHSGIRVPQDCEKLEDAVELVQWHMGQGKYAE